MSEFTVVRTPPLTAAEAWRRLTDWPAHSEGVPLTAVRVLTPGPTAAGTVFTARTGFGPLGFDDPMEVVVWRPPGPGAAGRCRLEKRGRLVLGWAEITVREEAGTARVVWREELRVRSLPRALDAPTAAAGRLVFGRAVDRLLRG